MPVLWAFTLQVRSKNNLSCDHICVLAKSRDICPLSSSTTISLSSIQVSLSNLPSYSLIMTIGSSSFPKVINYLCVSRIPQSPSMPKSGNVCGRHYTHHLHMQLLCYLWPRFPPWLRVPLPLQWWLGYPDPTRTPVTRSCQGCHNPLQCLSQAMSVVDVTLSMELTLTGFLSHQLSCDQLPIMDDQHTQIPTTLFLPPCITSFFIPHLAGQPPHSALTQHLWKAAQHLSKHHAVMALSPHHNTFFLFIAICPLLPS